MITAAAFWKGRDQLYKSQLTPTITANAQVTIDRANKLLAIFYAQNPKAIPRDANSGWRPPEVNSTTRGASATSLHMTGEAVDIGDDDEALDNWLMGSAGQAALAQCQLWMEHPSATPRWAHVQTRQPRSGNRVFYP